MRKRQGMEVLKTDLLLVLQFYGGFILAYAANILFSLYLNIKVDGEDFNKYRLFDACKKALVFVAATLMLVIAVDVIMLYLTTIVPEVGEQMTSIVTVIAIVATIGRAALKYIIEAYQTFQNVLNGKPSENAQALFDKE